MKMAQWSGVMLLCVSTMVLAVGGCAREGKKAAAPGPQAKGPDGKKDLKVDTKHEGWWCQEHGIPEEICSLCSEEAAAKFKKDGDWCKIHERAQSQCFKCDPSLYKKFEAMYVAKYGNKPEPPPKEEFEK